MVNKDNQTIGNWNSRVYEGSRISKACVKCSAVCLYITQIDIWLPQASIGTNHSYLLEQTNCNS